MTFYRFVGHPGNYNKLFNRWRLEEVSNLVRVGVEMVMICVNDFDMKQGEKESNGFRELQLHKTF